jgi:hypothetical protein
VIGTGDESGIVTRMDKRALQTQFSLQATGLAESFRGTVGRVRVGPHGYVPDLTAPEGQSTGGGVQALQHVRLVPPQPTLPTLVVGHANQRDGTAELRTWEYVDALCRDRFKQSAPIDPSQYELFLQSAQGFLAACGLRVTFTATPPELTLRLFGLDGEGPARHDPRLPILVFSAVAVFSVLAALVIWSMVLVH